MLLQSCTIVSEVKKQYNRVVEYATENPLGVMLYAGVGALMGGLGGQILDVIPFVENYVPKAIQTVTSLNFQDNLDKVGAVYGFAHGLVEGMFFHKKVESANSLEDKL